MGNLVGPRNRGPNVGVTFCLGEFTRRFFATLGYGARFTGPGPLEVSWCSGTASRRERFAISYLAEELFSKFDDGVKTPEKRERAISKFEQGEISCSLTNAKFCPIASGQSADWLDDQLEINLEMADQRAVFLLARKHINRILGAFPGWDNVLGWMDFGPGATTRLARRRSGRENKWAGRPHVTQSASWLLDACVFDAYPLVKKRMSGTGYEIVAGNKLDWVPKNYKTDRTIAIEPDWNMYLQKGLGGLIRRRLKRAKIDLNDQGINRFLAQLGSIDQSLATLDLSMASDTVSFRLVEFLIRPDWFQALLHARSHVGFYTDRDNRETAVIYEKFSSMGNGFTFELETLIFWGILRAVAELSQETDRRIYVYGDDIVVPTNMAGHAMYYLKAAGFHINPDKSFASGPFRESCGGHYFEGSDVTPFYVREPVDSLDRLFLLHNNVYRWFDRQPGICDPVEVRSLLEWVRSFAPERWRRPRLMTVDVGDGAFIGSFDEVCPSPVGKFAKTRGWEGWRAEVLTFRPKGITAPHKCATFLCDAGCPHAYPLGSGPDIASLHRLENTDAELLYSRASPIVVRQLGALSSASASATNIPDESRFWYVGTQVLPYAFEESWWKLT